MTVFAYAIVSIYFIGTVTMTVCAIKVLRGDENEKDD